MSLNGTETPSKKRRRRITVIKKKRNRDGSMSVQKELLYDMTMKQAIEAVKQRHKPEGKDKF